MKGKSNEKRNEKKLSIEADTFFSSTRNRVEWYSIENYL